MGNCMETCSARSRGEEEKQRKERPEGGSFKQVKVTLTREELELLVLLLRQKEGMSPEDVLAEICAKRSSAAAAEAHEGWKPSLESIMEVPEVQGFDPALPSA